MTSELEPLTKELLARVDERTKSIQGDIVKFRDDLRLSFASLSDKIRDTENRQTEKYEENKENIDEIKSLIDTHYTKKTEFDPIKKIVYGFVGFLLLSIGGMFIAVIARPTAFLEAKPSVTSTINQSPVILPVK